MKVWLLFSEVPDERSRVQGHSISADDLVLYFTKAQRDEFSRNQISAEAAEALISIGEADELDRDVYDFALNWHVGSSENELTSYRGIQLGTLVENEILQDVLIPLLKVGAICTRVRLRWPNADVFVDLAKDDVRFIAINAVLKSACSIASNRAPHCGAVTPPKTFSHRVFERGGSAIFNLVRRRRKNRSKQILLAYYSAADEVLRQFAIGDYAFAIHAFKFLPLSRPHVLWTALMGGLAVVPIRQRKMEAEDGTPPDDSPAYFIGLMKQWRFRTAGIQCLLSPIIDAINPILCARLPQYRRLIDASAKLLDGNKYALVLVPNDVSADYRVLVQLAKARRIPTAVYQHGFPLAAHNRDGFHAESLLSYSAATDGLYHDYGVPHERMIAVGAPKLDVYARKKPCPRHNTRRLLVITYPFGMISIRHAQIDADLYLESVLDAAERVGDLEIQIRPHPSENTAFYERAVKSRSQLNIRLSRDREISNPILWSDVVVSPDSTAFFEAIVADRSAVCHNVTLISHPYRRPVDGRSGIPVTRSTSELTAAITAALSETSSRMADAIGPYLGKLDGLDSHRFLNTVEQLVGAQSAGS